jgi:ankyrin repeat protein
MLFARDKTSSQALLRAIDADDANELSQLLLRQQSERNKVHKNGQTLLTRAALDGREKCARVLIEQKFDVNTPVCYDYCNSKYF